MSLGTSLGAMFGGATGSNLGKTMALNRMSDAGGAAIEGANAEAEMEITAGQLDKIKMDKNNKLRAIRGEIEKATMSTNEKNASLIQF